MPLVSLYGLIYKGKATGAVIDEVVNEEEVSAKKWQRASLTDQVNVVTEARGTQLIGEAFEDQVVVETVASAKQWATTGFVDSIGASPSEYDIAQAVWLMLKTAVDVPGTMGEALNDAGSAGNPWTDTANYPVGSKGALLKQAADDAFAAKVKP